VNPFDPNHPHFSWFDGFAPCRLDHCPDDDVHPAHDEDDEFRIGRKPRTCPRCNAKLEGRGTCGCGWVRPTRPAPRRSRAKDAHFRTKADAAAFREKALKYTKVIREVKTEAGELIHIEWRCPLFNIGGCGGRGWRKAPSRPCKVCRGLGMVTWSYAKMIMFLTTPATERGSASL
jgi:hypothetical protein